MDLLSLALIIIVVGVLLWAVKEFIPMDERVKQLLQVVVIIVLVIYVLQAFGLVSHIGNVRLK